MGLHAHVRCNCFKDGKAAAHPDPDRLRFDGNGEPFLEWEDGLASDWDSHEHWLRASCPHEYGQLVFKCVGNVASIGHVRAFLDSNQAARFPVLRGRVVYDGTHGGDAISADDAGSLVDELRQLRRLSPDVTISEFCDDMIKLAEASVATKNPIVF